MLKNKIMKKRKVIFTDNEGFSQAFIFTDIIINEHGNYFYIKDNIVLFLPSWCAFATVDFKTEIPDTLCLPTKK
jgi:hypothetical protein